MSISFHLNQCVSAARDPLSSRRPCVRRRLGKEWGSGKRMGGSEKRVKKWEKNAFCGKRVTPCGKRKFNHGLRYEDVQLLILESWKSQRILNSGRLPLCLRNSVTAVGVQSYCRAVRLVWLNRMEWAPIQQTSSNQFSCLLAEITYTKFYDNHFQKGRYSASGISWAAEAIASIWSTSQKIFRKYRCTRKLSWGYKRKYTH